MRVKGNTGFMILKCKMCGGGITVREGKTSVRCEYCGSNTTLPKVDDERVAALYNRREPAAHAKGL